MDKEAKIQEKRHFLTNIAFYAVIIALFFLLFRYLINLLLPFFLALIFAAVSRPIARFLSSETRWKRDEFGNRVPVKRRITMNRTLAGIVSVVLLFLVIAGLVTLIVVRLAGSIGTVVAAIPGIYTDTVLPELEDASEKLLAWAGRMDKDLLKAVEDAIPNVISSLGSAVTRFSVNAVTWISSFATKLPSILLNTIICLIATVFIAIDFDAIKDFIGCNLPDTPLQMVIDIKDTFLDIVWQFLRSYALIFVITAAEIAIGLLLIGAGRPLALGLLISLFDAFPIVGSGMILLPWAIFTLMSGATVRGIGLFIVYAVVVIARQIIEPKIVGKHVGMKPIVTLVCMYVGTELFGTLGLFALPITVAILTDMNERGLIHLYKKPETAAAAGGDEVSYEEE